ncbi:hypothetical protein C0068_14540 [Zhongshania marina]|uniref:Haloacid dehalogenase-like hydrolase n=1 Tax=Zhongshania marina TaxID=2304603 RepID=A0A2S4HE00_9GAMM|nr:hypothetical protein C0068_14540 [Marortus luteolus]
MEFKAGLEALSVPDVLCEQFWESMRLLISAPVMEKIQEYDEVVIYTAAPSVYAKHVKKIFQYDVGVVSSRFVEGVFYNNFGVNKLADKESRFGDREYTLFTDSVDDFPLARNAMKVFLCNPVESSRSAYQALFGASLEIIEG